MASAAARYRLPKWSAPRLCEVETLRMASPVLEELLDGLPLSSVSYAVAEVMRYIRGRRLRSESKGPNVIRCDELLRRLSGQNQFPVSSLRYYVRKNLHEVADPSRYVWHRLNRRLTPRELKDLVFPSLRTKFSDAATLMLSAEFARTPMTPSAGLAAICDSLELMTPESAVHKLHKFAETSFLDRVSPSGVVSVAWDGTMTDIWIGAAPSLTLSELVAANLFPPSDGRHDARLAAIAALQRDLWEAMQQLREAKYDAQLRTTPVEMVASAPMQLVCKRERGTPAQCYLDLWQYARDGGLLARIGANQLVVQADRLITWMLGPTLCDESPGFVAVDDLLTLVADNLGRHSCDRVAELDDMKTALVMQKYSSHRIPQPRTLRAWAAVPRARRRNGSPRYT